MATASHPRFRVLHSVRLAGLIEPEGVAARTDIEVAGAESLLGELVWAGLLARREGRMAGYTLTPAGREAHCAELAAEVEAAGCRKDVDSAYCAFRELNVGMLQLCTDWQIRSDRDGQQPNDHSDARYDAAIVERLAKVDDDVQPICSELSRFLDRFSRYGPRLGCARAKVVAGEREWLTRPLIDSYHTVWFELHEDLLATLAIDRTNEEEAT